MSNTVDQPKRCPGYFSELDKKWLPCRSILPFPRGFKGSYVDQCPGGCGGTGAVDAALDN